MQQRPGGSGPSLQGFRVQNHWVASRLTQPFTLRARPNEYQEFLGTQW